MSHSIFVSVDGGKAPVKPTRPSINRPAQSDYMNVTTQPPPQDGENPSMSSNMNCTR